MSSGSLLQETIPNTYQAPSVPPSRVSHLLSKLMLPVVLTVFAAPYFVLLFYSVPATDDFCKATLSFDAVPQRDVLSVTWLYYTKWSPRWLTTFIQSYTMSNVDLARAYAWLLLSVILSNLASLWYFFRTVFSFSRARALLVAAVFYATWVTNVSSPEQHLYWLTGATEYSLSISTILVLIALLYRTRHGIWYSLAIAALSIAIPAQHEIAGVFMCMILAAGAIVRRIMKLPVFHWCLSFGLVVLSQATVMLSPGNAVRAAVEHRHLWDIAQLPRWIAHAFYHGLNWLSYPSLLLGACCIVLLAQEDRASFADNQKLKWLGMVGACTMFALLWEVVFVETATGIWIPARVVAWFEFMFWLLFICVMLMGVPEIFRIRFSLGTKIGVFTLLAITLLGSSNFRSAVEDLRGPAQAWWRASSSRLHQHGGSLELEVPAAFPHFAIHQNLTEDSGCWVNKCVANYLGAKTVTVRGSTEKCPQ